MLAVFLCWQGGEGQSLVGLIMSEHVSTRWVNSNVAMAFLLMGALLSCLIFADRWTTLPINFPSAWYRSRNFHVLLCVCFYVGSWLAFRHAKSNVEIQDATHPVFQSVKLYTRESCHLCEQALTVLSDFADVMPEIILVDLDENPEFLERYSMHVPVVEIDGRVRFRGVVSRVLLRRMIESRQRQLHVSAVVQHLPARKSEGQGG